ncbi:MAG: polyhydroxyalkanoate synthesis repressor PhaR [Alphaproteobacteria bacterium]
MSEHEPPKAAPVLIKKYANRRLYNTATSSYVTLDSLCQMVRENIDFIVQDAKTGEDITRSVLTQIIVEEEGKGHNLLPINFLRQIITLYGDRFQALIPRYLEASMEAFARNQNALQRYFERSAEGYNPFASMEELGRQNMAMFTKAMSMFAAAPEHKTSEHKTSEHKASAEPDRGATPPARNGTVAAAAPAAESAPSATHGATDLDAVRAQLAALEKQLERLEKKGKS